MMKKIIGSLYFLFTCFALSAQTSPLTSVTVLDLQTNDMVYDSVTDKLYVSIKTSQGIEGNSLGIINLDSLALENTIYVGNEPNALEITDDGQYIYIGLKESPKVKQFIVGTQQFGQEFTLGTDDYYGALYAHDISAMPGQPNTIAVSRVNSGFGPYLGTAIFDSGIKRDISTDLENQYNDSYVIQFINDSILFGFNNRSTGYDLNTLQVDSTGVYEINNIGSLIMQHRVNNMVAINERVVFDYGSVIDASDLEFPYVIGEFQNVDGPGDYDEMYNLICFVTKPVWPDDVSLKRFTPDNYLLVDSMYIGDFYGNLLNLVACGNGKYAFNTDEGKLVLINTTPPEELFVQEHTQEINIGFNNPVEHHIKLELPEGVQLARVQVYNTSGLMVKDIQWKNQNKIPVSNLSKGMYFVNCLTTHGNRVVNRVIKK